MNGKQKKSDWSAREFTFYSKSLIQLFSSLKLYLDPCSGVLILLPLIKSKLKPNSTWRLIHCNVQLFL